MLETAGGQRDVLPTLGNNVISLRSWCVMRRRTPLPWGPGPQILANHHTIYQYP
jgi:hypothetical protein